MSLPAQPASQAPLINRSCAWLLLGLSGLTLAWSVCQLAAVVWLARIVPPGWLAVLQPLDTGLIAWLVDHATSLSVLQLLSCLPCIAIGVGMLRHAEAARIGFIVLLLASAVLNLASLPLLDRIVVDLATTLAMAGGDFDAATLQRELVPVRAQIWIGTGMPLLALGAVHGWLAWRFAATDMRALYRRAG